MYRLYFYFKSHIEIKSIHFLSETIGKLNEAIAFCLFIFAIQLSESYCMKMSTKTRNGF